MSHISLSVDVTLNPNTLSKTHPVWWRKTSHICMETIHLKTQRGLSLTENRDSSHGYFILRCWRLIGIYEWIENPLKEGNDPNSSWSWRLDFSSDLGMGIIQIVWVSLCLSVSESEVLGRGCICGLWGGSGEILLRNSSHTLALVINKKVEIQRHLLSPMSDTINGQS